MIDKILNYVDLAKEIVFGIWENLWGYWYVRIFLLSQIVVNLLSWALASYIVRNVGQPQIALHYSVDFGIDLFDDAEKIFVIPFLGLLFIIFNILIVSVIEKFSPREARFSAYLLFSAGIGANFILLAALASIYLINFR
jgi:hypothetical protein